METLDCIDLGKVLGYFSSPQFGYSFKLSRFLCFLYGESKNMLIEF